MGVSTHGFEGIAGTQNGCLQFYRVGESIEVWVLESNQEGGSYLYDEDVVVKVESVFRRLGSSDNLPPIIKGDHFRWSNWERNWSPSFLRFWGILWRVRPFSMVCLALPSIGLSFACLSFLFSPSTVGGPTIAFMQLWRCHGSETETEISWALSFNLSKQIMNFSSCYLKLGFSMLGIAPLGSNLQGSTLIPHVPTQNKQKKKSN